MHDAQRHIAILIFDDVEELDFVGPLEVLAAAGRQDLADRQPSRWQVSTVAESARPVRARNGLVVVPRFDFASAPAAELLIVPGGPGTRPLLEHRLTLDWITQQAGQANIVASVCTGALLLARCGLLAHQRVTTHHRAWDELARLEPTALVCRGERVIDNGRLLLSAGVASGLELALHLAARLTGPEHAQRVAEHLELSWPAPGGATAERRG